MKRGFWFSHLILVVWFCIFALSTALARAEASDHQPYPRSLGQVVQQTLDHLDATLIQAAREVGSLGIRNPRVNDLLRLVLVGHPFTISCSVISTGGFMIAVEPAEFSRLEDYNLRAGKDRPKAQPASEPTLTRRFPTAEGGSALAMTQPIRDGQGNFLGWLSLLLDPAQMMRSVLAQAPPSGGRQVWLVQDDGVLLYHGQAEDIGRNLLHDPAYADQPGKTALGRRLLAEAEGELTVNKEAGLLDQSGARVHWVSVGLHGVNWRLVVLEPVG